MSLIKKKRGKINVHFGWLGLNHKRKNLSFTSTFGVDPSDWVGGAWVMNRPIFFFYMQINEHRWLDVKKFLEITKKFNGTHLSGWPSAFFGPALPLPSFSRNRDTPFRLFSMANVNWRSSPTGGTLDKNKKHDWLTRGIVGCCRCQQRLWRDDEIRSGGWNKRSENPLVFCVRQAADDKTTGAGGGWGGGGLGKIHKTQRALIVPFLGGLMMGAWCSSEQVKV